MLYSLPRSIPNAEERKTAGERKSAAPLAAKRRGLSPHQVSSRILTLAKHVGLVISKHCSNKSTRCGLHPALATLHLVVAVEMRMRRRRAMACAPEGRAFAGGALREIY